jgi:hypothetical protein
MSIETWWHGGESKTKTFYGKAFGKRNFEGAKKKKPFKFRSLIFLKWWRRRESNPQLLS